MLTRQRYCVVLLCYFNLRLTDSEVFKLASLLGSDVPAALAQRLVLGLGTGEQLIDIEIREECRAKEFYYSLGLLIVKPLCVVSTARAYEDLGFIPEIEDTPSVNQKSKLFAERESPIRTDLSKLGLQAAGFSEDAGIFKKKLTLFEQEGSSGEPKPALDLTTLLSCFANDFERVVFEQEDEMRQARRLLEDCGAARVLVAGSGSALFGFMPTYGEAQELEARLLRHAPQGWFIATAKLAP